MSPQSQAFINKLQKIDPDTDPNFNEFDLSELVDTLKEAPDSQLVIPEVFAFLEKHPDANLGAPGALVFFLEGQTGYETVLIESVRKQPTFYTTWMINRIMNTLPKGEERTSYLEMLRFSLIHPLVDKGSLESLPGNIERQEQRD